MGRPWRRWRRERAVDKPCTAAPAPTRSLGLQRLRQQLQQRAVILGNARSERLASMNLRKLLHDLSRFVEPRGDIDAGQYEQALEWMKRIELRSSSLRQTSWVNWHVVRRGCREFAEIRNLIANCGERPAEQKSGPCSTVTGGALIDTAV